MECIVRINDTAYLLEVTFDSEIDNAGTIGDGVPVFVAEEGTRFHRPVWEPAPGYEDEAAAAAEEADAFTTFI